MIRHIITISMWVILSTFRTGILLFFDILFPILWTLFACYVFTGGQKDAIRYSIIQSLILVQLGSSIFSLGLAFIELRRSGVLRLLYTTTVSKHSIILGTMAGRLSISIIQFFSMLITSEIVFKPGFGMHWIDLGILTIIFSFSLSGLAVLLSQFSQTQENYHTVSNIIFFIFVFLSGLAIPFFLLPPALQQVGKLLPPYHMVELANNVIKNSISFTGVLINLFTIFIIGIGGYIKGVVDYKWDPNFVQKRSKFIYNLILVICICLVPYIGNIVSYSAKGLEHLFKPFYVLKVKSIFDGQNLIDNSIAYIGIQGEKIAFVGKNIPDNWKSKKVYDYSNYYAIPGLTDGHIHLGAPVLQGYDWKLISQDRKEHDLKVGYLGSGIVAIRSLGDDYADIKEFRKAQQLGLSISPIILISGPIFASPDGHSTQLARYMPQNTAKRFVIEIDTPEQAREKVNFIIKEVHPDWIKAVYAGGNQYIGKIPRLKEDVLKALIEESHKNNIRVTVHIDSVDELKTAVELGADMIEHLPGQIIPDSVIKLLKERNTYICPMVFVRLTYFAPLKEFINKDFIKERLYPPIKSFFEKYEIKSFLDYFPEIYRSYAQIGISEYVNPVKESLKTNLRKLVDSGITLLSCSDAGNTHTFHGPGLLSELQTLVYFGLTPKEALQTSTYNVEQVLNVKSGKIKEGYSANIAIYEKNPLDDISNLYTIKAVIIKGKLIQIKELINKQ